MHDHPDRRRQHQRSAGELLQRVQPGMLCLADRQFFGFELWNLARDSGAGVFASC